MAEIEISILSRQCLDRYIGDVEMLKSEITAWEQSRNARKTPIIWSFTSEKARTKLARLYPSLS